MMGLLSIKLLGISPNPWLVCSKWGRIYGTDWDRAFRTRLEVTCWSLQEISIVPCNLREFILAIMILGLLLLYKLTNKHSNNLLLIWIRLRFIIEINIPRSFSMIPIDLGLISSFWGLFNFNGDISNQLLLSFWTHWPSSRRPASTLAARVASLARSSKASLQPQISRPPSYAPGNDPWYTTLDCFCRRYP